MGFCSRFFIALLVVCVAKGAWAQCCSCDTNDGCLIGEHNLGQNPNTGYVLCEPCGGLLPGGGVNCDHCNCYGYDDPCPFGGNPDGKKCKKVDDKCPGSCEYYKLCDIATGNITATQIVGACHMENDTCYSNTRACRDFSSLVYNFGQVTCLTQSGSAVWNSGKWDVSGCSCDVPSVSNNLNDYFRCAQFGTHVGLYPNQNVQSIGNSILYMMDRLYCEKCPAGYLPTITDASSGDIYARPDNNGNWGVITCGIQVQAPDYAPGCVIDFNLPTDDMMAECRKTCPDGFATESDGATDITQCIADYSQTYEDSTGFFVLTSFETCP